MDFPCCLMNTTSKTCHRMIIFTSYIHIYIYHIYIYIYLYIHQYMKYFLQDAHLVLCFDDIPWVHVTQLRQKFSSAVSWRWSPAAQRISWLELHVNMFFAVCNHGGLPRGRCTFHWKVMLLDFIGFVWYHRRVTLTKVKVWFGAEEHPKSSSLEKNRPNSRECLPVPWHRRMLVYCLTQRVFWWHKQSCFFP